MSRVEELIAELCPDGVVYKTFSEIADYIRGLTYGKSDELKNDSSDGIPVLRANNITIGQNELNFDDVKYVNPSVKIKPSQFLKNDDILICAGSGSKEHVGKVAYIRENMEYAFGGFMAVIRIKNPSEVMPRFMFHVFTSQRFRTHIGFTIDSSTINNLNAKVVSEFKVPVPPIEVQREIVRILDDFRKHTSELTAKLATEFAVRKEQFEYYRETLMKFDNISYVPVNTLFPFIRNGFVGTVTKFFTEKDDGVRYLEGTNIHDGTISDNEELYVTKEFHRKHIKNELREDDILMVQSGHIGECAVVGEKYKGSNCHALIIMSNGGKCISQFYVHYFHTIDGKKHLKPAVTNGTLKHVLAGKMSFVKVPFPPIKEQKRVVSLLDRLGALCNDLSSALADELEARQKQYEYYRDKLLTFKALT